MLNLTLGAWLAAGMGGLTAVIDLRFRSVRTRFPTFVVALAGATLGALAYGGFVIAGAAVSLLTFSSAPDAGPALICVLLGCALFVVLRLLGAVFSSHFGLPPIPPSSRPHGVEIPFNAPPRAGAAPIDLAHADPARAGAPDTGRPLSPQGIDDFFNARLRLGGSRFTRRRSIEDVLDAEPRGGRLTMWLAGVALALLPLYYGVRCIATGQGDLGTLMWGSEVHGIAAIALGLGWIGVALFLHFHFFFGLHPGLKPHSRKAKLASVIVAGIGLTIAGAWPMFDRVIS